MSVEVSGHLENKKIQVTMNVLAEKGYQIPIEQIQKFLEDNVRVSSVPSFDSLSVKVKLKNKFTADNEKIEITIE